MADPIQISGSTVDLSPRFAQSSAITGSPTSPTIAAVCTLTFPNFGRLQNVVGVELEGFAAFTVGASGSAGLLQIRQTGTSGSIIAATGAVTQTAGNLTTMSIQGLDTAPLAAGVWVLCLTPTGGTAVWTVSNVQLFATAY